MFDVPLDFYVYRAENVYSTGWAAGIAAVAAGIVAAAVVETVAVTEERIFVYSSRDYHRLARLFKSSNSLHGRYVIIFTAKVLLCTISIIHCASLPFYIFSFIRRNKNEIAVS